MTDLQLDLVLAAGSIAYALTGVAQSRLTRWRNRRAVRIRDTYVDLHTIRERDAQ